jgi:hypothetical protein
LVSQNENRLMVFENRVLRGFGRKRGKLHNKELHRRYSSPIVITMIKSRRMRWTGHVASMVEKYMHNFL